MRSHVIVYAEPAAPGRVSLSIALCRYGGLISLTTVRFATQVILILILIVIVIILIVVVVVAAVPAGRESRGFACAGTAPYLQRLPTRRAVPSAPPAA
jgi:hypothetical protein